MKYLFTLTILLNYFSGISQLNNLALNNSNEDFNSLSISQDSSLVLIGQNTHVDLISKTNTIQLKGTHAIFNHLSQRVITYSNIKEQKSNLYIFELTGSRIDSIQIEGSITGICNFTEQILLITVNVKIGDNNSGILIQLNTTNAKQKTIFSPNIAELTSVSKLSNNNIALTGTGKNYIINMDGIIITEIDAPHRSFGKTSSDKKTFLILQEYSDGSYIDIYDENGKFIEKIEFKHLKNPELGTRRCSECITKSASFYDFDLSLDKKFLVAKDQYNEVYVLNENRKLIETFKDSNNWSFMTFIDNNKFIYLDQFDKKVKIKIIKSR